MNIEFQEAETMTMHTSADEARTIVFALMSQASEYNKSIKSIHKKVRKGKLAEHNATEDLAFLTTELARVYRMLFAIQNDHDTKQLDTVTKFLNI